MSHSIMIIGASGRLGLSMVRAAAKRPKSPQIHAFVRTPLKIPADDATLCTTIQKGDALNLEDIIRALKATKADIVVVAVGVPNSTAPSDLRYKSAVALMAAVKPGTEFDHIRIVCVSSIGAGGSHILVGMGIGALIYHRLKNLLRDHDLQEDEMIRGMGSDHAHRLMIVRPVGLIDGKPTGTTVVFKNDSKVPSVSINRTEVAQFILEQICGDGKYFGQAVNIASTSKQNGNWGVKALLTLF